ncbi:hypothetical protein PHO31112_04163 [Pandoraea horticolens]|uniref:Uncharacterized protein n=1 Tax=Pandoraea horticolens TaxID=2508298 RepID=A0A5E4XY97_9BURK|nr:hypothetical protein PHO31112_04163 [Pandoraea horticolens]
MKSKESQQGAAQAAVPDAHDAPKAAHDSVYASLCSKISLQPVTEARSIEAFRDNDMLAEASADERIVRVPRTGVEVEPSRYLLPLTFHPCRSLL